MPKHSPGKQALFDLYASRNASPNKAAMKAGLEEGFLFEPPVVELEHDDVVEWALQTRRAADPRRIANAFVASLSTRDLSGRPALASYAFLKHLPDHEFEPATNERLCAVCGAPTKHRLNRNLANWHRHAQGYCGDDDDLALAAFDLEQFAKASFADEVPSDAVDALNAVLDELRKHEGRRALRTAEKGLAAVLKSNKTERERLIEVLAMAGVLLPAEFPSPLDAFTVYEEREGFPIVQGEWDFPALHWHGGVREDAVDAWFGQLLRQA